MNQDTSSPTVSRQEMTFDEYDAGIIPANGRTIIHSSPKELWRQNTLIIEDAIIQLFREGGSNSFESDAVDGFFSFGFTLPGLTQIRMNGVDLNESHLAIIRPGDALITYAEDVCKYCIITFPFNSFVQSCKSYDPHMVKQLLTRPSIVEIDPAASRQVLDIVGRVMRVAQDSDTFRIGKARESAVQDLLRAIFYTAASLRSPLPKGPGRPQASRQHVLKRVREYLNEGRIRSLSVADMAQYVGCSERKLRQDVMLAFGVSPKKLLSLRRLHDIRVSLQHSQNGQTVTEIAAKHGEWEMGRFASRYHHLFGEYPSETLKHYNR